MSRAYGAIVKVVIVMRLAQPPQHLKLKKSDVAGPALVVFEPDNPIGKAMTPSGQCRGRHHIEASTVVIFRTE